MAHKVHPYIYRLGSTTDWKSRWFAVHDYRKNLMEDVAVRSLLEKTLRHMGVEHIEFERSGGKLSIIIFSARPGLIIGRAGAGVEELRNRVIKTIATVQAKGVDPLALLKAKRGEKELVKQTIPQVRIEIREVRSPEMYASLVASSVAEQIEKRMPFRRVIKRSLERVMMNKEVKGAKIVVKGRLDGAEMSRRELVRSSRLPLQTIRADVDYAQTIAYTTYGTIGVSVWVYKGEKL